MALTAQVDIKTQASAAQAPVVQKIELELALYQRYNRAGVLFVAKDEQDRPVAYRFTPQQAAVLLQEVDDVDGRPIWRRPRKTQVQTQIDREVERTSHRVLEASGNRVEAIVPDEMSLTAHQQSILPEARLDVGDDSEIADILAPLDNAEKVTI